MVDRHIEVRSLGALLVEPGDIFVLVAGVDDNEEPDTARASINDDIVDHATVRIAEKRVLRIPRSEHGNIVRCDILKEFKRVGSADIDLAHVTEIK